MTQKPIFVATHPRACSTAFERVFMTRRSSLSTFHEPFSDAYYYGPERLAERYMHDAEARLQSGFAETTYRDILGSIVANTPEGNRVFIKDMAQCLMPQNTKAPVIAASLVEHRRGVGTRPCGPVTPPNSPALSPSVNPTVLPTELLDQFHFTFLIRHPRFSIPSYYRCCIDPLSQLTGFDYFRPDEAGYEELRRLFDYLRETKRMGPYVTGQDFDFDDAVSVQDVDNYDICVVDADDLLDDPETIISTYCESVGIRYDPDMLRWGTDEQQAHAAAAFAKWKGFHEDALYSAGLQRRAHRKQPKTDAQCYQEWVHAFGNEAADLMQRTVEANVGHYEYLKQFAIKI